MINEILFGDCRDSLRAMAEAGVKVQMCVTSPPYFGLRDYGHEGQIGLEETPEQFIAELVEVFRCVREVLADDGTLWLNCGDSYSTGVPNLTNLVKREFERGVFFFGSADPRGRSSERINVLLYDKRAPNRIFKPLFTAQRVSIKQWQHDLCEIGGAFDAPVECFSSCAFGLTGPNNTNAKPGMDLPEHVGIIVTTGDLRTDAALRNTVALTIKDGKAPLAIEISTEPMAECITSCVPAYDAVTLYAHTEGGAQVDSIDNSIALLDGPNFTAGNCCDFTVREAGSQKLTLALHDGTDICFAGVAHLFLADGGLSPYSIILDKAKRKWNSQQPKQELGVPEMLKRALMEDGWICRQTIIWAKPNPMPESVTDRCTKAHEYLFLLSKSPRYYFDHEAIKEPAVSTSPAGNKTHKYADAYAAGDSEEHRTKASLIALAGVEWKTRNRRSVWTIATKPYKGAHSAVFPPDLVEPCILAGSRPAGKRCDCDEIIRTPTGTVDALDPSLNVGRAGMSRPRSAEEGSRPITRREQRHHAQQMKQSPHRTAMENRCGPPFAHYIRTDSSGARPLPEALLREFLAEGWITEAAPCDCPICPGDVVLDCFMGSGTTAAVAIAHDRQFIGCELNRDYKPLQDERISEAQALRAAEIEAAELAARQLDLFAA